LRWPRWIKTSIGCSGPFALADPASYDMVDSDIANAIAAGKVPDGITAAYLQQSRDGGPIAGMLVVGVLAIVIACARLYARMFVVWKTGFDDYLIMLTLVSLNGQ
jgi:hypothetical protein